MKGVVLTSTGETLATPSPPELANLFNCSPKVGLNFAKIFDFANEDTEDHHAPERAEVDDADSPLPSPSSRKEQERKNGRGTDGNESSESSSSSTAASAATPTPQPAAAPPTRIRRPSIRLSVIPRSETLPTPASEAKRHDTSNTASHAKPLPHPHLRSSGSNSNLAAATRAATSFPTVSRNHPSPECDLADEENLPSPFLKRIERAAPPAVAPAASSSSSSASSCSGTMKSKKRGSSGLMLRAVAAANNASRRGSSIHRPGPDNTEDPSSSSTPSTEVSESMTWPSLASARKTSEEARKALLRP